MIFPVDGLTRLFSWIEYLLCVLFTFLPSPFCDVAPTSDCGISFKALYVVSLRRPTVASFPYIYLFTFRGVASDTRSVVIYVLLGFQADYRRFPFFLPRYANIILMCIDELIMLHPCMHLLYLTSELSCEYFQSTHWLVDLARCWRRRSHGWRVW